MMTVNLVILITFLFVFVISVQNEPIDLSLLVERNKNGELWNATCVLSGSKNVTQSALIWMDGSGPSKSRNLQELNSNELDCTFNQSICNYITQNWISTNALLPLDMSLDYRWEDFNEIETNISKKEYVFKTLSGYELGFPIHVSVLAEQNAHLLICLSDETCFWFIIEGWKEKTPGQSALRICNKTEAEYYARNVDKYPDDKDNCCNRIKIDTPDILNKTTWSHFTVLINKTDIVLKKFRNETAILQHAFNQSKTNGNNTIEIGFRTYLDAKQSENILSYWKIHQYTYAVTNTTNRVDSIHLPKKINQNENCLKMFVAMCETCQLKLSVLSEKNGHFYERFISTGSSRQWTYLEYNFKSDAENSVLRIKGEIVNNSNNPSNAKPFWAIDDVKGCDSEKRDVRVLNRSFKNAENISCQTVDSALFARASLPDNSSTDLRCNKEDTFGDNCLTCEDVLGKSCQNVKICNRSGSCSCSFGYSGYYCETELLPALLKEPEIIATNRTSVTVRFDTEYTPGTKPPAFYLIQYENVLNGYWTNETGTWSKDSKTQEKTVTNLLKKTDYKLRVVLCTSSSKCSFKNIKSFKFSTCERITNESVDKIKFGTNATGFSHQIPPEYESAWCTLNIKLEAVNNRTGKGCAIFDNTQLQPDTEYSIIVTQNGTKFERKIRTKESTPGPVSEIKHEREGKYIKVNWNKPSKPNGKITNYQIKYKKTNCKNSKEITELTKNESISIVLDYYSSYKVEIRASTKIGFGNYAHTDILTKPLENPTDIEIPQNLTCTRLDNTSATIEWNKIDCNHFAGELQYVFEYSCKENTIKCISISKPITVTKDTDNKLEIKNLIPFATYDLTAKTKRLPKGRFHGMVKQIQFKTLLGIPTMPLNLKTNTLPLVSSQTNNEIILNWNHPEESNGIIKQFRMKFSADGHDTEETLPINEKNVSYEYKLAKAKPGHVYSVSVWADNGNVGVPATLNKVIVPSRPPKISSVQLLHFGGNNFTISAKIKEKTPKNVENNIYLLLESQAQHSTPANNIAEEIDKFQLNVNLNNSEVHKINNFNENGQDLTIIPVLEKPTPDNSVNAKAVLSDFKLTELKHVFLLSISKFSGYVRYEITSAENYVSARDRYLLNGTGGGSDTDLATIVGITIITITLLTLALIFVWYLKKTKRLKWPPLSLMRINAPRTIRRRQISTVEENGTVSPDLIPSTSIALAVVPKLKITRLKPKKKLENTAPDENIKSFSNLLAIQQFEDYVKETITNGELAKQHELLPRGLNKPHDYGSKPENFSKNRYKNLIAYDETRVKLNKIKDDQYSDYINANYIDGYEAPKGYIATQGPKPNTLNDFWRMIWEQNCTHIVMLTNVTENGKKKTEQYWPEAIGAKMTFGNVLVTKINEDLNADYAYRSFSVTCNETTRHVEHLHFTSWPDHGVPIYSQSLVPFIKAILAIPQRDAPMVVHCSAGVGRTGTVIMCDICLRMAAREGTIDPLSCFHRLRQQRANMVDTAEQYKFAHLVLVEALFGSNSGIACDSEFTQRVTEILTQDGVSKQMLHLESTEWQDGALRKSGKCAMDAVNASKNRFSHIYPENGKLFLQRYPLTDPSSDYVNAITVDGFHATEKFVVTQVPLPNTLGDFWRLIAEKRINVIVVLNETSPKDKTVAHFFPTDKYATNPVPYLTLQCVKKKTSDAFVHYVIEMTNETENPATTTDVNLIQMYGWQWNNPGPDSLENLLLVLDKTDKLSNSASHIAVCCYDAQTASGLFVALSFLVDKMKMEQICDVCLAVRTVRRNRQQFVRDKFQFELLYLLAVTYLKQFETYSNFGLQH